MSDLVRYYKEYYREQTPRSIDSLFSSMLDYDFSSYHEDMRKIFFMHRESKCIGGCAVLRTNGSSSESRTYSFGPHFDCWKWKIEPFLRNLNLGRTLFLICKPGPGLLERLKIDDVNNDSIKHYDVTGNFLREQHVLELFSLVEKFYGEGQKTIFSSFPDIWNILLTNLAFANLCVEHKDKIVCLVNSDFEMFHTTDSTYTRNQMINWPSGLNFFVCEQGLAHFLPSFFSDRSCVSLINLAKTHDSSDAIFLSEQPEVCLCGRPRLPLHIQFHKKNLVVDRDGEPIDFKPLSKLLSGRYQTFQIHQDLNDAITVFLSPYGNLVHSDLGIIESFLEGIKMTFSFNRYFDIGAKRYCFWRSDSVKTKELKLK